jgi:hypothetical protein
MSIPGILAGVACMVGGVILLMFESAGSHGYSIGGHNVFETATHGLGLYCIGKGLFVILSIYRQEQIHDRIVDLGGLTVEHGRRGVEDDPA